MSIQVKLNELVTSINNGGNPQQPVDYQEKVDYVKDLIINGFAINKETATQINQNIVDMKAKFPSYNDALLDEINNIITSVRLLLSINQNEPLIGSFGIIHPRYIKILTPAEAAATNMYGVDGQQGPIEGCKIVGRPDSPCVAFTIDGTKYQLASTIMSSHIFSISTILQSAYISVSYTHLTLPTNREV